jgi:SecD/SecF fusion protein
MNTRRVVVVLSTVVLIGAVSTVWFFLVRPGQPNFDDVGGTILIYEIDPASIADNSEPDLATAMAAAQQRRLDRNKLDLVGVLPSAKNRVEIRIPRISKDQAALVGSVKDLISQVGGHMELRILANNVDDREAIAAAMAMLNEADGNPQLKAELDVARKNGLPPPPPRNPDSKEPRRFSIKLPGGGSVVSYSWVELGTHERQQLHLNDNAVEGLNGSPEWEHLAARRNKAIQIPLKGGSSDEKMLRGALFFNRECHDRNMPEEDRRLKLFDYFVLARNPEIDPATDKETWKIDGSYLVSAKREPDASGRPAVSFTFNGAGGKLLGELSRMNLPSGEDSNMPMKRHLAIILDDLVLSAPTINSEVRERGMISGNFTNREIDHLVNVLRAGALPAKLKSTPVSHMEVPAKNNK